MKYSLICFLLFIGVFNFLHAQDKIVLRSGQTIEVKVHRIIGDIVGYTYPGGTSIYERPTSVISYIIYADGRREVFDQGQRPAVSNETNRANTSSSATNRTTAPSTVRTTPETTNRNSLLDDEVYWQDVKTTFTETEVRGLTRLNRISAKSSVSYRDAIQQLKKKAAEIGGTVVLVMDIPENDDIEVMGVVYRDDKATFTQRSAAERNAIPEESSANIRRRQIAQQMESYNNESNLEFNDYSRSSSNPTAPSRSNAQTSRSNTQPARSTSSPSRQANMNEDEPDAVYLLNGRTIKGTIEELEPDEFVSIRTAAGRVYEFSMDDVKRISQESAGKNNRSSANTRNASASSNRNAPSRYDNDRYSNNTRAQSPRYNDYDDYYSVSGYKGFFDAGYNVAMGKTGEKGNFEINTSHGYKVNEYFFAGAGLGLHIFSARDSALKNQANFPHYTSTYRTDSTAYLHAVDSSYMTLPIFLDIRGYLPLQNSKITPFFMFRFGYAFNLSDGFKGMGIYMNPAIGLTYNISNMIGINFSVGYSYQSYGGIPKNGGYGYYYYKAAGDANKYEAKGAGGISLKLGIEF